MASSLVGYRQEQRDGPAVQALMAEALAANPHVPAILAEEELASTPDDDTPGSVGEADLYVSVAATRWDHEPGAVAWLLALAQATRTAPEPQS